MKKSGKKILIWNLMAVIVFGFCDYCTTISDMNTKIETNYYEVEYQWPLRNMTVTSAYGYRWGARHKGIDLAAKDGTPVLASANGKVKYARWEPFGYGYLVIIEHADGVQTYYAHNRKNLVKEGQTVKQGQMIARVGRTGLASGSHLHFEYRINNRAVNPALYMLKGDLASK